MTDPRRCRSINWVPKKFAGLKVKWFNKITTRFARSKVDRISRPESII